MRHLNSLNLKDQSGMMLLEALIAILIFSLGILGMVAINARAVEAATDSQARADAAKFTSEIASRIALAVDRTSETSIVTDLLTFQHQVNGDCNNGFTGTASIEPVVTEWVSAVIATGRTGLPGATASGLQILVAPTTAGGFNQVSITICWQQPGLAKRRHQLISYVN